MEATELAETANRQIAEADDNAYRAQLAYRLGLFGEYMNSTMKKVSNRLEAEYERLIADADGGDSGADSGSESDRPDPEANSD